MINTKRLKIRIHIHVHVMLISDYTSYFYIKRHDQLFLFLRIIRTWKRTRSTFLWQCNNVLCFMYYQESRNDSNKMFSSTISRLARIQCCSVSIYMYMYTIASYKLSRNRGKVYRCSASFWKWLSSKKCLDIFLDLSWYLKSIYTFNAIPYHVSLRCVVICTSLN